MTSSAATLMWLLKGLAKLNESSRAVNDLV